MGVGLLVWVYSLGVRSQRLLNAEEEILILEDENERRKELEKSREELDADIRAMVDDVDGVHDDQE